LLREESRTQQGYQSVDEGNLISPHPIAEFQEELQNLEMIKVQREIEVNDKRNAQSEQDLHLFFVQWHSLSAAPLSHYIPRDMLLILQLSSLLNSHHQQREKTKGTDKSLANNSNSL
jgi:hypothetical protein